MENDKRKGSLRQWLGSANTSMQNLLQSDQRQHQDQYLATFDDMEDLLKPLDGSYDDLIIADRAAGWERLKMLLLIWTRRIILYVIGPTPQLWVLLFILGCVMAIVSFSINYTINLLFLLRSYVDELTPFYAINYVLWIIWSLFFLTISFICVRLSPQSAGSGIPEMKHILSGMPLNDMLTLRTLAGKVVGLITAFAGGLSVGTEGPFIHISSIIANQLLRMPVFWRIRSYNAIKLQVLAAACAVGVTTSLGAPIGGLLFSVEVVSTYYLVDNLWKSFFASLCGAVVIRFASLAGSFGLLILFNNNFEMRTYDLPELVLFSIVGIVGGMLGGALVRFIELFVYMSISVPFLKSPTGHYGRVVLAGAVIALLSFNFPMLRNEYTETIEFLLKGGILDNWYTPMFLLFGKFIVIIFSLSITGLACGLYTPIFILGAIYGRLCGEILVPLFPGFDLSPSAYAIVGAASLCAGSTHTISSAVVVMEVTGQLKLAIPLILCVLCADVVGHIMSKGIYDTLLVQKGIEPITLKPALDHSKQSAVDVMIPIQKMSLMNTSTTGRQAVMLLRSCRHSSFPIVDQDDRTLFLGTVQRFDIVQYLLRHGVNWVSINLAQVPSMDEETVAAYVNREEERGSSSSDTDEDDDSPPPVLDALLPFTFPSSAQYKMPQNIIRSHGLLVDTQQFQMPPQFSVTKVHFTFTMLGLGHAFVVDRGMLLGVITRKGLLQGYK